MSERITSLNQAGPYPDDPVSLPGPEGDPLGCLAVLDRLEVGPVGIDRRRLVCPYTAIRGGSSDTFDLIYRWEEDVFDARDRADLNLAGMIAAQVALNWGLFADEIRFLGPFDRHDRGLLVEMAENTATETYVKKFLEPNPFLVGPAAALPVVRRGNYLRARLTFPGATEAGPTEGIEGGRPWRGDPDRHAVLESGGKDSLLTYGLLAELGQQTHPIFVNESGRHWFTALCAYRHFAKAVPRTARVWTNSDRLFSWMNRRLPFVRPDFARIRSDEYPIRLWTVAVFAFAALPLIKKRGIGRLSIGDEFDTTRFCRHEGIGHYDGLFDQSILFDRRLSDYYRLKGWGIEQFSVLRPLSEILIQKILAARYPELLRRQVSCHAAHIDGGRVRPCGRCEKCRRIVGMLSAFGADPSAIGYSEEQVKDCLAAIGERGVHQEDEGAEHLYYLLTRRGKISRRPRTCLPRPEIEKLRFDPLVSPADAVPPDLSDRLYAILAEHADGAVTKDGPAWVDTRIPDGRGPKAGAQGPAERIPPDRHR
jgi:hypothetical protein